MSHANQIFEVFSENTNEYTKLISYLLLCIQFAIIPKCPGKYIAFSILDSFSQD